MRNMAYSYTGMLLVFVTRTCAAPGLVKPKQSIPYFYPRNVFHNM